MQARKHSRGWGRVVPIWIGIAATGLVVACGDDDDEPVAVVPPVVDAGTMEVFVPGPPPPTPPPPVEGGIPPAFDAPSEGAVPSTAAELFPWLQDRSYSSWTRESEAHPSAGPHGNVRVYVSPSLEASLQAGDATHPVGAAAVKELISGDEFEGWAAMVKVAPGTGADTWYFYEIFSTTDPSSPVEGRGAPGCAGCHSIGRDHFRSAYPLR